MLYVLFYYKMPNSPHSFYVFACSLFLYSSLNLSKILLPHIFLQHFFFFHFYCHFFIIVLSPPYHLYLLFPLCCVCLGNSLSLSIYLSNPKKKHKKILSTILINKEMCTDSEIIATNNDDSERTDIASWLWTSSEC